MDRVMLYDMIYALAACGGREAVLFGNCAPLAHEAFERSLAGDYFPELWFELPLTGDPWFDFHALAPRGGIDPEAVLDPKTCGNAPEAFTWFANREDEVLQLALSWDTSAGDTESPAVQLLTGTGDVPITCDFLTSAGRPDAAEAFRAFSERIPESWCACYAGIFPRRPVPLLRVECIPDSNMRRAYAQDASLMEAHLRQAGLTQLNDEMIARCAVLANMPFQSEFQFDIEADGRPGSTFSMSVRFAQPPGSEELRTFEPNGPGGALMRQVEQWGLADDRWQLLSDTAFAQRASFAGESTVLYCYPAFLKLRWRDGEPVDAKTYLMAGTDQELHDA